MYPPGGCCVVFLWRYVIIFFFRFRILAFTEAAALFSIVLRSLIFKHLDSHTQFPNNYLRSSLVFLSSFFSFFADVTFSKYFCTVTVFSLSGEYVVRFRLLDGVFVRLDPGLGGHQLMRKLSEIQKIHSAWRKWADVRLFHDIYFLPLALSSTITISAGQNQGNNFLI